MVKEENIRIGNMIRDIRISLNLDQKEFSKKIGTTVSALSNWENGRNKPKMKSLKKISEIGNVDVNELLHGSIENFVYTLLKEEILNKNKLYRTIVEYLRVSTDLSLLENSILYNEDGSPYDMFVEELAYEEIRKERALSFLNDRLDDIMLYLKKHIHSDQNLYNKRDLIVRMSIVYVDLLTTATEFSLEGLYRSLVVTLTELIPHRTKEELDNPEELYKKRGLSEKELKLKLLNLKYESKVVELQKETIKKLDNLWNEYVHEKSKID